MSGYKRSADRIVIDAADKLIEVFGSLQAAESKLSASYKTRLPVPSALLQSTDSEVLAHQLIYIKTSKSNNESLSDFLLDLFSNVGIKATSVSSQSPVKVGSGPLFAFSAVFLYAILCSIYIFFTPLFSDYIKIIWPIDYFGPIEWPLPDNWRELAFSVVQRTFSFVFPLAFGYYFFAIRRRTRREERVYQTLVVAALVQFSLAFAANMVFLFVVSATTSSDHQGSEVLFSDLFTRPYIGVELISYSLAPCLALAASVIVAYISYNRYLSTMVICIVVAIAFAVSQYAYEMSVSHWIHKTYWTGYTWHQLLFGLYLSLAYFAAAGVTRYATLIAVELNPDAMNADVTKALGEVPQMSEAGAV